MRRGRAVERERRNEVGAVGQEEEEGVQLGRERGRESMYKRIG